MRASELITELRSMIGVDGDLTVVVKRWDERTELVLVVGVVGVYHDGGDFVLIVDDRVPMVEET